MFTDSINAECSALLAGIEIPLRLIFLSLVYALISVLVCVGVMSPCGLIMVPKCLTYLSTDAVTSWFSSECVSPLYVSLVVICACIGYMCLYDQAVLLNVGILVPCAVFVMVTRHFSSFLPIFVTSEKAPPLFMYHWSFCVICDIVSAAVYLELSSQYDSRCMFGWFALFVLSCVSCCCMVFMSAKIIEWSEYIRFGVCACSIPQLVFVFVIVGEVRM